MPDVIVTLFKRFFHHEKARRRLRNDAKQNSKEAVSILKKYFYEKRVTLHHVCLVSF
jgi:hypothetical protein